MVCGRVSVCALSVCVQVAVCLCLRFFLLLFTYQCLVYASLALGVYVKPCVYLCVCECERRFSRRVREQGRTDDYVCMFACIYWPIILHTYVFAHAYLYVCMLHKNMYAHTHDI